MKKLITLMLALICSISIFATRYLVQTGAPGAATWRAAGDGESLVDLTVAGQAFNAWYTANVVAGDEVWMANGTYVLSAVITITENNHSVYGGFAGTETATSQREKVADAYPWEFTNETILDGNNSVKIILASLARPNVLFDGLTLTKSNTSNGAAQYRNGVTLQNCKIIDNTSTDNGGGINLYRGGSVIDSYIAGNVAVVGGGVYSNMDNDISAIVSGCLIENNRATGANGGGGVRTQGAGTGTTNVINCVIRGNIAADGETLRVGGAISTNNPNNNFDNCLIYNNEGSSAIRSAGGNYTNITVVNNVGQFWIQSVSATYTITNSIIWGNKTDATGATNTGITSNTTNTNVVINNTAVHPGLASGAYTQADNIELELGNDSQVGAKGPGFVTPTTFWGAPTNSEQTDEYLAADWNIKYTSGCLDLGKTLAGITTDIAGTSRPQGSAYDIGAYELAYYNTTVTFNEGGTVNALTSGDILSEPKGKPLVFTITPTGGQQIASVKYNDVEVKQDMVDGVYTAPVLAGNATLVVEFSPTTSATDHFRSFASGNWNEADSWESSSDNSGWNVATLSPTNAAASVKIMAGHLITVSTESTSSGLSVQPGANLSIATGQTLNITGNLLLESSSNATASFVNAGTCSVSGTSSVQQYFASGRNWYFASPVSNATSAVIKSSPGNQLWERNVSANSWTEITTTNVDITPLKGYVGKVADSGIITFTGNINNGNVPALTLTSYGVASGKFHLVGNPYPSYLDWQSVVEANADVMPTLWYRTKTGTDTYTFATVLMSGSTAIVATANANTSISKLIPPMQAFWVRINDGLASANFTVNNSMRSHADVSGNRFKAPAAGHQLLRLEVTNGTHSDEAVIYFNQNASDAFDRYDAPRMFNNNPAIPEIYTHVGNERLVINGLNRVNFGTIVPLGFQTGQKNNYSIRASELLHFDSDMRIFLIDNVTNQEFDMTEGDSYDFTAEAGTADERFSVQFKSASGATNRNEFDASGFTVYSDNSRIYIALTTEITVNAHMTVYNGVGQLLHSQNINTNQTSTTRNFNPGVYLVKVENGGRVIVVRTIVGK